MDMFKKYDTEKSGMLSPQQVSDMLRSIAKLEGYSSMKKLKECLEANGEGLVSPENFLAAHVQTKLDFKNKDDLKKVYTAFGGNHLRRENLQQLCELDDEAAMLESRIDFPDFERMFKSRNSGGRENKENSQSPRFMSHVGRSISHSRTSGFALSPVIGPARDPSADYSTLEPTLGSLEPRSRSPVKMPGLKKKDGPVPEKDEGTV